MRGWSEKCWTLDENNSWTGSEHPQHKMFGIGKLHAITKMRRCHMLQERGWANKIGKEHCSDWIGCDDADEKSINTEKQ